MTKQKFKLGSIFTGVALGSLFGIYLNLIIPELFAYSTFFIWASTVVSVGYLSYIKPKFTEYLAFAIGIYILLQVAWDWAVLDRGNIRLSLFFNALILLITNSLTGHVKFIGAKNTFKRAIGL